jgi:hypothetical protein
MEEQELVPYTGWKPKVMVIGAVIGAAVGLGAAYLFTQKAKDETTQPRLTASDGVKLGLLVLGLLRAIADLGE